MVGWERHFARYPPGWLVAEAIGRIHASLVSTKERRVRLRDICPWVALREADDPRYQERRRRERREKNRAIAAGYERLKRQKAETEAATA